MATENHTNPLLQLAYDFVNFTQQSVFLTGKAGTGKTTFLQQLRHQCPKQHAVLAPTGVAAINAGGSTIHSFFQLPFTPFLPSQNAAASTDEATGTQGLISRLRYNREKRELLRSLDLLIIDEISMVRCDILDAIDSILRHFRENPAPFGGVQMLFIGDMYQLPPVIQEQEWQLLQPYYKGPFFFNSLVVQQQPPVYIELQTIYRQSDERFIQLLNEVRNNQLTKAGYALLNSRYQPNFKAPAKEHYITLNTHNRQADAINEKELQELSGKLWEYKATIEGDFNEKNYPADENLRLKIGAQVMFLKNDAASKKYFNGKIGVVSYLGEDEISVTCPGDERPLTVKPDIWRNVQYTLNRQLNQVEEKEIGSFIQFPLRLAWAVTIHKSQGLTFEKAIIDAASSFSAGQVYVALSRCKSLEGLILRTQIPQTAVRVDDRVQQFSSKAPLASGLAAAFAESRYQFEQHLLAKAFDPQPLQKGIKALQKVLAQYTGGFGAEADGWLEQLAIATTAVETTAQKFQQQLQGHFTQPPFLLGQDAWLNGRIQAAAPWFTAQLNAIHSQITEHPAVSDSEEQAAEFEQALAKAFTATQQWRQYLEACSQGFDTVKLLRANSKISIAEITGQAYVGTKRKNALPPSPHPALLDALRKKRDDICRQDGKPVYIVASSQTLNEAALYLPRTPEELMQIKGFGAQKVAQYGEAFLTIINDYCEENQLQSQIETRPAKKAKKEKKKTPVTEKKDSTQEISLALFIEMKDIQAVAKERNLQPSTIEGHLVPFILEGRIDRNEIISPDLFQQASEVVLDLQTTRLGAVKEILGEDISFGQIRLVVEWLLKEGKIKPDSIQFPEP